MTNEEARIHLKMCKDYCVVPCIEATELAIKALENEPKKGVWEFGGSCFSTTSYRCPFCKSKSLERTKFCSECGADMREAGNDNHIYEAIRSGTPYEERPKGKWIKESDCEGKTSTYTCSCCGFDDGWYEYRYCPECGAVIQGVKEADNETDN